MGIHTKIKLCKALYEHYFGNTNFLQLPTQLLEYKKHYTSIHTKIKLCEAFYEHYFGNKSVKHSMVINEPIVNTVCHASKG